MKIINFFRYYLCELYLVHRKIWLDILKRVLFHLGPNQACSLKNTLQRFGGRSARFSYDHRTCLYSLHDQGLVHFFGEKMRGFELYSSGLQQRAERLAASYLIDQIQLSKDDVIIDCGANYADLFIYFKSRISAHNYHSFEPSPTEFQCIELNAPGARNNKTGLYKTTGKISFYVSSEGGDSSMMMPQEGYSEKVEVETLTLEDYFSNNGLQEVKLLKLEAEGLEPEILEGAVNVLKNIEYISVDGGEERGANSEETLSTLANFLIQRGFVIVAIDIPTGWGRALFKNTGK